MNGAYASTKDNDKCLAPEKKTTKPYIQINKETKRQQKNETRKKPLDGGREKRDETDEPSTGRSKIY